jgi:lipopolysaccharide transport system permease protein
MRALSMGWGLHISREYLRDLILVLVQKEIRIRYRNTWLGYAWSLLHPLTFTLVYYIAFGMIMRVPIDNYAAFLIVGLFPWQWISQSLITAPNIFLANAMLIKKVKFPWNMLVVSVITNLGFQFLLSVPFMAGIVIWSGYSISLMWLLGVPLLTAIQFATLYGACLAIASVNLFFRDLDRLVVLGVTFLFFLTPIAYSIRMIPTQYEWLLCLNPLASVMLSWQQLFLTGAFEWKLIWVAAAVGLLSVTFGTMIYSRLSLRFAEVI